MSADVPVVCAACGRAYGLTPGALKYRAPYTMLEAGATARITGWVQNSDAWYCGLPGCEVQS